MSEIEDLHKRVSELEQESRKRKEQEQFLAECDRKSERIRACGDRGHEWKANDNMGWFYTCRVCGLLWNAMRRDAPGN